ncbi:MAG TPA: alpha/beta fold hydrolase [Pseudonocardiaceae bacterium]|nr:alpha/beta fold hydrolase [Pseudonocardiaceae bacterium]
MYPEPRLVRVDDRVLTVEDTGPADGFPVLVHSGHGSRHVAPAAAREARDAGLRLIGYDRPAYGGSTPRPGRSLADCAPDVEAVLRELDLERIAVWGFSAGGPYALATAALLPKAVAAVCLFASPGPYGVPGFDFLDGLADTDREDVHVFFTDRAAARERFRRDSTELYDRAFTPGADDEAAHHLASVYRDGWTHGDDGRWDDWSAFLRPWGIDFGDIIAPVGLWHGDMPAHSRWLASQIPHSTTHHSESEDNDRRRAHTWIRDQLA